MWLMADAGFYRVPGCARSCGRAEGNAAMPGTTGGSFVLRQIAVVTAVAWTATAMTFAAQNTAGTLVVTVRDQQGGALGNAQVLISSPALIGGSVAEQQ